MKRISLVAGVASIAALVGVLWSVSAAADIGSGPNIAVHRSSDKMPQRVSVKASTNSGAPVDVPEPGTLALFALGLGGIGVAAAKRRRTRT